MDGMNLLSKPSYKDFLIQAIVTLAGENSWYMEPGGDTYEDINWNESNADAKPSLEETERKINELTEKWEREIYAMKRRFSYPPIEEQLDIMYHGGYEKWREAVSRVKEMYPKPGE